MERWAGQEGVANPEVIQLGEAFQLFMPERTSVRREVVPQRFYTAVELPTDISTERIRISFKAVTPFLGDFTRSFTLFPALGRDFAANPLRLSADTGMFENLQRRGHADSVQILPEVASVIRRLRLQIAIATPKKCDWQFVAKPLEISLPELVGFELSQFSPLDDKGSEVGGVALPLLLPDSRKNIEKIRARFVLTESDNIPLDSLI